MKHVIHTPTADFAFVETEFEGVKDTWEDTVMSHNEVVRMVKGEPGLPDPEWRKWLDEYLATGTVVDGQEGWAQMSEKQKFVVNEIKKSIKRKSYENN